jgi:mannose-6-phosphate isomerase-like protein (cupin superfamily)
LPRGRNERLADGRGLHLFVSSHTSRKILARGRILRQTHHMPKLIPTATRIAPAGNKPKIIDEYIGRVNSADSRLSIAHMRSPAGWVEPGQTPEFDEYTVVLRGQLRVTHKDGAVEVNAGQAIVTHAGEWVQYSTPGEEGAEYIAVCLPAFSPQSVHRDDNR